MIAKPQIAAGYARVSTADQVREGISLEAQAEQIRSYSVAHGLTLSRVYVDAGVSGGVPLRDRPQGAALLEAIGQKKLGHVVALKLDRLFRNTVDCLETVQLWDRTRVGLHLIDFNGAAIDTRSAVGKFFLTMAAGFSEMERALIGERTSNALQHKKASGIRLGGIPFGFDSESPGGALVPNSKELAAVRVILEMRANPRERHSYREIATHLTSIGVPTRHGGSWHGDTVRGIAQRASLYQLFLGTAETCVAPCDDELTPENRHGRV